MKEKRRYIVYEVISDKNINFNFNDVYREIKSKILSFLGEDSYSKASVIVLNEWKNNKGIIKVNNKYTDMIRTSLMLIKKISSVDVVIRTKGVSGLLNKAKLKYF
ncbi:MAG: Rpp14/Pop5 family protein [Candidatus Woesearchaeota archaeon]|nr:Rpp14/Pop5 family protein [Candidatus Woesearchaeota archaeon]